VKVFFIFGTPKTGTRYSGSYFWYSKNRDPIFRELFLVLQKQGPDIPGVIFGTPKTGTRYSGSYFWYSKNRDPIFRELFLVLQKQGPTIVGVIFEF
jgi:hypothetical protein